MPVPPLSAATSRGSFVTRKLRQGSAPSVGFLLLVLSGCTTLIPGTANPAVGATAESTATEETTEEPERTTSAPAPTTQDTGLSPATVGQVEGFVNSAGDQVMTFTVDAISLNPGCNSSIADPPAHGNFVAVDITINILALTDGQSPLFFISGDWHIIGPTGVRDNDNATIETFFCTSDSEQLPTGPLGVGTYVGRIVLDTANTTGQVIWTPGELGGLEGWSWTF